jgi:putative addiction module component (TIGR02574 family)
MEALSTVLEKALQLSDEDRGALVDRLLQSLEADEIETTGSAWDSAWSIELNRRVGEAQRGEVALIDGDQALAEVRAALDARRR